MTMKTSKIFLLALAAMLSALVFFSCDRLDGTASTNAAPHVEFVNTPFDSTEFNYAPIVYWRGYDNDGLISGFSIMMIRPAA
jgi:hypothetical protein